MIRLLTLWLEGEWFGFSGNQNALAGKIVEIGWRTWKESHGNAVKSHTKRIENRLSLSN
jgi:hypothetical protein